MDFANESYVRVYTRDTMTWKRLNWQARCVWSLLLRKLDRAGLLDLEGLGTEEAVCLATELPPDVVDEGLPRLLERGVIEVRDGVLIAPRFLEAQECTKSDTLRSREYRERRRSQALALSSQNVTAAPQDVMPASREITERTERHEATETSRDHHSLLCSALPSLPATTVQLAPVAVAVSAAEKRGRAWYGELVEKLETELPSAASAYEFFGSQPEDERRTVAANLRASSVHGLLKARRALRPQRIVDSLWHSHLLSEAEHAAQKAKYGKQPAPAASSPTHATWEQPEWMKAQ